MTMNRQFKKQTFVFGILNNLPNLYFGRSPRQNMTVWPTPGEFNDLPEQSEEWLIMCTTTKVLMKRK